MLQKRIFSNWLQAYIDYASESEAPSKFHFWTAVSAIAGALRRNVWISQGYFEWTPNFYIVFVAPPGIISKSSTADIGMSLLRQVPGIKFGPDSLTWQALAMSMAESTEMVEMPDGLFHSMSAITIASSEFGNLLNPNDREMVDLLVALWDARKGVWRKVTKTSGNDTIENPWINIIACTTPAWIAGYFPEYLIGGGFTSRCIFVYGDTKRQLVAYPGMHIPKDFLEQQKKLVADLEQISLIRGEFTMEPAAIEWGIEWYANLYKNKPQHLDNEKFAGYIARKQTHIHKLSMVISAAQSDSLIITKQDLQAADHIVSALEADLPKVFYTIGQTQHAKFLSTLLSVIKGVGKIEQSKLLQQLAANMGKQEYDAAMSMAVSAGLVKLVQEGSQIMVTLVEAIKNDS